MIGPIENLWRHWWAGHMQAVGGTSRLPREPLDPETKEFLDLSRRCDELEKRLRREEEERARLQRIAALPPRQRLEESLLEWRRPAEPQPEPRRRRQTKKLAREVGDIANTLLDRLVLAPHERKGRDHVSMDRSHISGRRHLEDCDFHLIAQINNKLDGGGRYYEDDERGGHVYLSPEHEDHHELVDMFWPVDCAFAADKGDDWTFVNRLASVAPKEIRGLVKLVPPKCAISATAYVPPEGAWRGDVTIVGWIGRRWVSIDNQLIRAHTDGLRGDTKMLMVDPPDPDQIHESTAMTFSAMLTHRFEWHVAFGRAGLSGPRLVIPTNPRGCLELFKSRELTNGETRRRALRHWVDEHYRQRSDDPTQLDYVCEHLRGHTRFEWGGLDCELLVSAYDLEKNEFFRRRAGEWRAQRRHNRVRVRLKRES
jgi:hypothetical protein